MNTTQLSKPFILLIFPLFFFACTNRYQTKKINYSNPEDVALTFMRHMSLLEINEAKELCTPETKDVLNFVSNLTNIIPEEERIIIKKESLRYLEDLDRAICEKDPQNKLISHCSLCCNEEGQNTQEKLTLHYVNKKWLICIEKDNFLDPSLINLENWEKYKQRFNKDNSFK